MTVTLKVMASLETMRGGFSFMCPECPKKFVSSKDIRDHCNSHQKLESEEENNGSVSVKVELVEHPEEIPIKEEPIKQNE